MELKCDVLVVGGGPSGCSAAYHSNRLTNYDVILCESKTNSKYDTYHRMCGEVVSKKLFDEITLKKEFIIDRITNVQEIWPNNLIFNSQIEGYIVNRPIFLNSLLNDFKQTGGKIVNNTIIDVIEEKGIIKVKTISGEFISCKYLIAADGANSVLRKKILPEEKVEKKLLLQYVLDKKPDPQTLKFYHDESYEGNYKWVFPYEDKEKIGYPMIHHRKSTIEGKILEKHARLVAYGGLKNYTKNNILFVGEAAAQTNALSLGGIRPGIVAGKMAAEAIKTGTPREYDIKWKRTPFASKVVNNSLHRLKGMRNEELANHLKPLTQKNKMVSYLQMLFSYRKYQELYKAYEITDEFGW